MMRKIFILSFFGCLFLFTGIIAAIQLPSVQKGMVSYVTSILAKYVNYPIEIEAVSINWLSHLVLHHVVVRDTRKINMIVVDEIEANFSLISLMGMDIVVKEITLKSPNVKVKWYPEIDDINISDFIYSFTHIGKVRGQNSPSVPHIGRYKQFIVQKVNVKNGYFQYEKTGSERYTDHFDFSNFELEKIHLTASGFKIVADTISMNIKGLNCIDKLTRLKVHSLDADFGICETYMKLDNLDAKIGSSHIKDQLVFQYNGFSELSDIQDSVFMTIRFNKSVIHAKDIALFIPGIKGFDERWKVSGLLKGKFTDLKVSGLDLQFGNKSAIRGNVALKGLPEWEKTWMNLDLENSMVYYDDLEKYGLRSYHDHLYKFNKIAFCGIFMGYPADFKVNGEFETGLGFVKTDFTMRLPDSTSKGAYDGILQLRNFDAKNFLNQADLNKVSGNFRFEGEGFELNGLHLNMNAFVENIGFKEYVYNNIISNIRWSNDQFIGTVDVKDSNLVADFIAKVDLRKEQRTIDIDAGLKKINLYNLKLYDKPLLIASNIKIRSKGFDLQNLEGEIKCSNTELISTNRVVKIDTLTALYDKIDNDREFQLFSDAFDLKVKGAFEGRGLWDNIFALSKEVNASFAGPDTINHSKNVVSSFQNAEFNLNFKNSAALFNLFLPDVNISPGGKMWGSFNSRYKKSLAVNADIEGFRLKNIEFKENHLKFYISKSNVVKDISSVILFKSARQVLDNKPFSENMYLHTSWVDENMDFEFLVKQAESTNEAKLAGDIQLLGDGGKKIKFSSATIKLLDDDWNIDSNNVINVKDKYISFSNFELKNTDQKIFINGELSENTQEALTMDVKNFDLTNLNRLLGKNLEGRLNGFVTVRDYFKDLKINSEVNTEKLKINKLFIGNILANSKWDNEHSRLDVKMEIERNGLKMFDLKGNYTPKPVNSEDKLNLTAVLNRTSLVVAEPFIGDILSDLGGEATGLISIKGDLAKPIFNGEIDIKEGRVKINYLNTTYFLDEKILFRPNGFVLNDIVLNDGHGGLAVVEGGVYHDNFKDFKIKMSGVFKNSEILNTTIENNNLYFGKVMATGNFSINGNFNFLDIKVDLQTRKGTRMYIPNNSSVDIEKQSFITFVKKKKEAEKPKKELQAEEISNPLKINLELNIDITADAYNEFILNPVSGDRIGGYGSGRLRIEYYSEGEFNMYGQYTFERESNYLFTFLNIANKKFNIRRGSTVSWNGSPYNGIIDVTASYDDRVSLHPLVTDTSYWNRAGIRTPYPVSTILYLKGDLMKPTISYDIQLSNYPSVISGVPLFNYVSAFESRIHNNVNDMNTQVFSLLVFRKFLYGTSELAGAADGTVSELLTNQLSQLVSQIDENLQVDFRMNGFTRDALNGVQVRVSYELLDGKIRITRSGGFTNSQSQATTASIIGDISVEYMLTDDGKFRLKGFTKNNPNVLASTAGSQGNSSTGVSIMHTTSFNSLNPFNKKKKKTAKDKK